MLKQAAGPERMPNWELDDTQVSNRVIDESDPKKLVATWSGYGADYEDNQWKELVDIVIDAADIKFLGSGIFKVFGGQGVKDILKKVTEIADEELDELTLWVYTRKVEFTCECVDDTWKVEVSEKLKPLFVPTLQTNNKRLYDRFQEPICVEK